MRPEPIPMNPQDPHSDTLTWKARLQLRLHYVRTTRPVRFVEKLVWLLVA